MIERLGLGRRQPRGRARQQRRLPPPALRGGRGPASSASSRPRNVAEVGHRARVSRRGSSFFGADVAQELRRARPPSGPDLLGNNVLAQVPDLNDFVAGMADPARARRRHDDRVPASAAADRGRTSSTPSTTSTSRTSRSRTADAHLRGARPGALRRRGAPDARRLAADLRPPCRRTAAASRRRSAGCSPRESGGRPRATSRPTAISRRGSRPLKRDLLEFLIEARRDGQDGRRLRRSGQGQHAAQLLRDPDRPSRLHGRSQSVQARPVHPRHPHPDPPAGTDRRDTAPTTS